MIIIISGPPASGKGTQAQLLTKKLRMFHMDVGRMLRKIAKKNPKVENLLSKGKLVPNKQIATYLEKYLKDSRVKLDNIIFDGFPRTIEQYKYLKRWLSRKGLKINSLIYLDIKDETALRRLSARRTCTLCGSVYNLITNPPEKNEVCDECGGKLVQREDDKEDVIQKRLSLFKRETKPVLEMAREEGVLMRVDAERPIKTIFEEILTKLGVKDD